MINDIFGQNFLLSSSQHPASFLQTPSLCAVPWVVFQQPYFVPSKYIIIYQMIISCCMKDIAMCCFFLSFSSLWWMPHRLLLANILVSSLNICPLKPWHNIIDLRHFLILVFEPWPIDKESMGKMLYWSPTLPIWTFKGWWLL